MKRRFLVVLLTLVVALLGLPATSSAEGEPTLMLRSDKSVYLYGQTTTFTVDVDAMNLDYHLAVRYPGSSEWKIIDFAANVNQDRFTPKLGAYYNAVVRAQLTDPEADDAVRAERTISVPVRATVATYPNGYYTRSGGYAVMSKYSAKFRSVSAPAFPGQRCLRHQVQRKYASGWRTVKTSACILQGKQGRVDWKWGGKHPSKVKYRVRGTFAGDQVNRPNQARWLYFRFR